MYKRAVQTPQLQPGQLPAAMASLAALIGVLRGEQPTPPSRTLSYRGPLDADSLSDVAEGLTSNMLIHGLRLEGALLC